ncbi:MAG TPA: DUF1573 domain-containing protein [Cyclobacteriaceae bacterium]|nr:DUF1573 domain-containing protein [Cyclobacteriaceae bacterium]
MRTFIRLVFVVAVAATTFSCRDKAAEKRIAELESRLSALEGNKSAASSAQATPTAAADPATAAPNETKPEGPLPAFKFERLEYDFGQIREGEKVAYTYKFTNTGSAPLIVQSVQPSCGCTAPDWSKEPIPVNGTGFVKVEFDSNGKTGIQNKVVTVNANTWPKSLVLRFKAQVNPKPEGGVPLR